MVIAGARITLSVVIFALCAMGAATAKAVTITPNATAATMNLTAGSSFQFTAPGITVLCTTHTADVNLNGTATITVAAVNNVLSEGGSACKSGFGGFLIDWITQAAKTITALSITIFRFTIPNNAAKLDVKFLGSALCSMTLQASTVEYTWTNATKRLQTNAGNTVNYTGPAGTVCASGTATIQETLTVTPGTVSVT